jgi:lipopolysaccharide export system permease protein
LITSIITFYQLSSKSEITIIRNCGYSIWRISLLFQISAFFIGILWISLFNLFEIWSNKTFDNIEKKYVKVEMRESIDLKDGAWFRQKNSLNKDEAIIMLIRKAYKNSDTFSNVSIWFFNAKGVFYKRIDTNNMVLKNNNWIIKEAIINDEKSINVFVDNAVIPTELNIDFIKNKILNNSDVVQSFSIFELLKLIKDLDLSGLNSKKFKVYFYSQLCLPLLFVTMVLFPTYFGRFKVRRGGANIKIFVGIVFGLIVFLASSISATLGSSGIISLFESTWLIVIIYFAISILLLYRKENS